MTLAITESSPTENETQKQLEGTVPRLQPDGVLSPRRVLTRHLLAEAVREALDDCSHTRCELSGVGARIVVRVGRELAGSSDDLVLYGSPKKEATRQALSRWGIAYRSGEFLTDYALGFEHDLLFELLLACESEVHPGHGVDYSFETNGYIRGLRKLLHCPAPNLLFVASLPDRRFAELQESITRLTRDYFKVWRNKTLAIVLVPTSRKQAERVLIGLGRDGMKPDFARIGAPADHRLTGAEYEREWSRLRDAGVRRTDPAFDDLVRRLSERDDFILEAFGRSLLLRYPGRWAAIDAEGRYFLGEDRKSAARLARDAFGFAGGITVKLEEGWGAYKLGPRSAG